MPSQNRTLFLALGAAVVAILIAAVATWWVLNNQAGGSAGGSDFRGTVGFDHAEAMGGRFTLTDQTGASFTPGDMDAPYGLIYFGFTSCPDVCPTELQDMTLALDHMAPDQAARITPIFITIDPERDDVAAVDGYVGHFHPRMVGLTGDAAAIDAAAKLFKVYYAKAPGGSDDGTYMMDHSSFYYLIDRDGELLRMFTPKAPIDALAGALGSYLADLPADG